MSEANIERGEISVDLEGVEHILRPSFEAQIAIERQTGKSIEQLADAAGGSSLSLDDVAIIVTECVKAYGRASDDPVRANYNTARVGELIYESGKLQVVKRLELLLYMAATGGYDSKGNPKALLQTAKAVEPVDIAV